MLIGGVAFHYVVRQFENKSQTILSVIIFEIGLVQKTLLRAALRERREAAKIL